MNIFCVFQVQDLVPLKLGTACEPFLCVQILRVPQIHRPGSNQFLAEAHDRTVRSVHHNRHRTQLVHYKSWRLHSIGWYNSHWCDWWTCLFRLRVLFGCDKPGRSARYIRFVRRHGLLFVVGWEPSGWGCGRGKLMSLLVEGSRLGGCVRVRGVCVWGVCVCVCGEGGEFLASLLRTNFDHRNMSFFLHLNFRVPKMSFLFRCLKKCILIVLQTKNFAGVSLAEICLCIASRVNIFQVDSLQKNPSVSWFRKLPVGQALIICTEGPQSCKHWLMFIKIVF